MLICPIHSSEGVERLEVVRRRAEEMPLELRKLLARLGGRAMEIGSRQMADLARKNCGKPQGD